MKKIIIGICLAIILITLGYFGNLNKITPSIVKTQTEVDSNGTVHISGSIMGSVVTYNSYKTKLVDTTLYLTLYSKTFTFGSRTDSFNITIKNADSKFDKIVLIGNRKFTPIVIWQK